MQFGKYLELATHEDSTSFRALCTGTGPGVVFGPVYRHRAGPCQLDRGGETLSTGTGSVVGWPPQFGAHWTVAWHRHVTLSTTR